MDQKIPLEPEEESAICEEVSCGQTLEIKALCAANKALTELNDFAFLKYADAGIVERLTGIVAGTAALLKELRKRDRYGKRNSTS